MKKPIQIGSFTIGSGTSPFLIAELSGNHAGSLDRAKKIIKLVANAGFDAIKLQTYTADTMTLNVTNNKFVISDNKSLWAGASLYQLYQKASTPWEWHQELFSYAKELGLMAFSTPFDESAVEFLETLNVPCYKIASFEITYLSLIKRAAQTGKPLIISTGMATVEEIERAIQTAKSVGNDKIILLKCTSAYPAREEDLNLATLQDMQTRFGVPVGFSDHTVGVTAAITSIGAGACVIEKHVTLDAQDGAVDSAFSLGEENYILFVKQLRSAHASLGQAFYGPTEAEKGSSIFRRAVHVCRPIAAGQIISKEDLKIVRPAIGLNPMYIDEVIGKTAKCDLTPGDELSWDILQ